MATRQEVVGRWWDERLGLTPLTRKLLQRHVPSGLTWWYSLGAATLFVLTLQFVTGILLALNYGATPVDAYDSVQYVTNEVPFGWFIRGLHHWGASAMIALVVRANHDVVQRKSPAQQIVHPIQLAPGLIPPRQPRLVCRDDQHKTRFLQRAHMRLPLRPHDELLHRER